MLELKALSGLVPFFVGVLFRVFLYAAHDLNNLNQLGIFEFVILIFAQIKGGNNKMQIDTTISQNDAPALHKERMKSLVGDYMSSRDN